MSIKTAKKKEWDFNVEERQITLIGNKKKDGSIGEVWDFNSKDSGLDKFKAIVDTDSNRLVSIVSKNYNLITNRQIVDAAEKAMNDMPELSSRLDHIYTFNNGSIFEQRFTFPSLNIDMGELTDVEKGQLVEGRDIINPTLSFFNSYNRFKGLGFVLGGYRLVCKNGLMVKHSFFQMTRRHSGEIDIDDLMHNVRKAIEHFMSIKEEWTKWKAEKIEDDINVLLEENVKYVGKKYIKMITEDWEEKTKVQEGTKWLLFNIVTSLITHQLKSRQRQLRMQASFNKLFYGQKAF